MFILFGLADVTMTPTTYTIYLWRHQNTELNSRKSELFCTNITSGNLKFSETNMLYLLEKAHIDKSR